MRFRAKKAVELEEESTLQLAWDCGAKYKEVDWQMRLRMRTRLLEAGFIEDPTAAPSPSLKAEVSTIVFYSNRFVTVA